MGVILRACVVCGRPSIGARCVQHQAADDRRRAAKSRDHGLGLASWKRTRRSVLDRDMGCCRLALDGCLGRATSVHRLPEYGPLHDENLEAYVAACERCHGVVDGRRNRAG